MGVPTAVAEKATKHFGGELQVDLAGDGSFVKIAGVENLPDFGFGAEWSERSRIDHTERQYDESMKTPPEIEFVFDDLPDDATQKGFITAVLARETKSMRAYWANGRVFEFDFEPMDHYFPGADADGYCMCAVKGRVRNLTPTTVTELGN